MRTRMRAPNRVLIAAVTFLAVGGQANADNTVRGPSRSVADQLVGGWSLVSRVTTSPDGNVVAD